MSSTLVEDRIMDTTPDNQAFLRVLEARIEALEAKSTLMTSEELQRFLEELTTEVVATTRRSMGDCSFEWGAAEKDLGRSILPDEPVTYTAAGVYDYLGVGGRFLGPYERLSKRLWSRS